MLDAALAGAENAPSTKPAEKDVRTAGALIDDTAPPPAPTVLARSGDAIADKLPGGDRTTAGHPGDRSDLNEMPPSAIESNVATASGVSRWPQLVSGIAIRSVRLKRLDDTETNVLELHEPFQIEIDFEAERSGPFDCLFVVLFFTLKGDWLSRHISEGETIDLVEGKYTEGL